MFQSQAFIFFSLFLEGLETQFWEFGTGTLCRKFPSSVVTDLPLYAGGGAVTSSYNGLVLLQQLPKL
jgi:hypothetical protein